MRPRLTHPIRRLALSGLIFTLAAVSACQSSIRALGTDPEEARRNASDLFEAFALRFDSVQRDSGFEEARLRLARFALIPSRVFDDSSVWTVIDSADSARSIYVRAFHEGRHFRFVPDTNAPLPQRLGEERHFMRLRSLGANDYEWTTSVDHAIGHVRPGEVASAIRAALTAAEGRTAEAALEDARATFPSAGAVLSRLLRFDSLETSILGDGSTVALLGLSFTPDTVRDEYPAFAHWLDKYVMPSVYQASVSDHAGTVYFSLSGRDGSLVARLRSRHGHLVPLQGGTTPLPDSLFLSADFSAKYGPFRIGFRHLVADFTIEQAGNAAAWMLRWRREPEWHFPFAFDKLLRNPLRRPFEGRGIELRLGVRDDMGPQTLSIRRVHFVVNESGVMRWIGGLGATAFGDFSGRTEREENHFLHRLFGALRADVQQLP